MKTRKSLLAILLSVLMMAALVPAMAFADDEEAMPDTDSEKAVVVTEETDPEALPASADESAGGQIAVTGNDPTLIDGNLFYAELGDSEASVCGVNNNGIWQTTGHAEIKAEVTINGKTRKVTQIGAVVSVEGVTNTFGGFTGDTALTSVTIPSKMKTIFKDAFLDTGLTSISIPESVTVLGEHAVGFKSAGSGYAVVPGFVIYCKTGSAAYNYAVQNGIAWRDLDAEAAAVSAEAAAEAAFQGVRDKNVPAVKGAKVKTAKKRFTVRWKKASKKQLKKCSKVEVQYCTSKAFPRKETAVKTLKKSKTSLKVKGLKKGSTYYVRVRYINNASGTKKAGKWSAVKKVKIK